MEFLDWLKEQVIAAFWIVVGVAMFAFVIGFGELVSGQMSTKKKEEPSDHSESP